LLKRILKSKQLYNIGIAFKSNNFNSFNELKTLFPHADQVGKLTVFNIGGKSQAYYRNPH
jgi:hypothetical protein